MIYKNITNFRKEIYKVMEQTIAYNETVNISTKNGNVVMMSEEDYNGLMETLALNAIPGMKDKIEDGMKMSLEDCVFEEEVDWQCIE